MVEILGGVCQMGLAEVGTRVDTNPHRDWDSDQDI